MPSQAPHARWIHADDYRPSNVTGSCVEPGVDAIVKLKMTTAAALVWAFTLMAIFGSGCAARSAAALESVPAPHDWSAVAGLATGSAIRVEISAGPSTTGRLVSVQMNQVTILAGGSQQKFLRPEIHRVVLVQRRTGQKAKRGLMVGAIAGGLVGGLATKSNSVPWAAFLAAGWGAIGAAIGASDGFSDRKETLVYVATNTTAGAQALANLLQPTSGAGVPW